MSLIILTTITKKEGGLFYYGEPEYDYDTELTLRHSFPYSEVSAVEAGNRVRAIYGHKLRKVYVGINIYNKKYSNEKGKLVPSSKKFNSKKYRGKFSDLPTVVRYLWGSKWTFKKAGEHSNKRTYKKIEDVNKYKQITIEKPNEK